MKFVLGSLLTLFLFSGAAFSNPNLVETQPISGDPFKDYRIEGCEGTKGFGYFNYSVDGGSVIRLSDICIDEETGTVVSAEIVADLELTKKGNLGRTFEDLSSGAPERDRTRVDIAKNQALQGCVIDENCIETINFYINDERFIRSVPGASFAHFKGYTLPKTNALPSQSRRPAALAFRSVSQGEVRQKTSATGIVGIGGDIYGEFELSGNTAQVRLNEGSGRNYGEAEGELRFEFLGDGEVKAAGSFLAKSVRLAGFASDEMVSIAGKVVYGRGYVLEEIEGTIMFGYGLIEGFYKDASGNEHPYRAVAIF